MNMPRILFGGAAVAAFIFAGTSSAQSSAAVHRAPQTIVVKLIERPGDKMPFAFEPAAFTVERGDIIEFVQFANTMHNVHFKSQPKGSKLGSAATSPYLIAKGETYRLVIDSRFVAGSYEIVCEPHEMIGMHAMLTVAPESQ
jgi:Plastocyanin